MFKHKEFFNSAQKKVIFFSMNGCGHCQNFKPTWQQLMNKYSQDNSVELIEVSVDQNPEIVSKYKIRGFPTILMEIDGKPKQTYQGNRSAEDVTNFIESFK
jgi:thioredoxin-like negative regulator of GroEL